MGQNLRKKSSLYDLMHKEVERETKREYDFNVEAEECPADETYKELKCLLTHLTHLPVFPQNTIRFFTTGKEKFTHLFADMEKAVHHIHIIYYTIGDDKIGTALKEILIRKSREGVQVRVIYDNIGSEETHNKYFKELKAEGVQIVGVSPFRFPKILNRINYRNHRKIVVIDGKIGYTGGFNVKDMYIEGVEWGIWKDVHIRIEGTGVQGLQSIFILDWYFTYKEYLDSDDLFPEVKHSGKVPLQVVASEPLGEHRIIMQGMFQAITRAKRSVYIETPYFVPTDSILTAIQVTAMSGIEVIMVLPGRSDNMKVQYASNSYIQQLLCANVKIYRYQKGFIHSKMMVIDDELTIVGSSNMDIRSFDLNFEDMVFLYNKEVSSQAKAIILQDIEDSYPLTEKEWLARPESKEVREALYRLFSPFL